jgi:hypothetical protein
VADRYKDEELQLICDYMERNLEVSRAQLAKLVAAGAQKKK